MFGGFNLVLWTGSVLCFLAFVLRAATFESPPVDNLYLGIALIGVSLITGLLSFYQDMKSSSIMATFDVLLPQLVVAIRDGTKRSIPSELLVPGDVVELSDGDIVPADLRILSASSFKVDNAVITGESRPLVRNHLQTSSNPFETKNLAFCGTYVVEGSARGLVFSTGHNTVLGRISDASSAPKMNKRSFISSEISSFIRNMINFAIIMGLVFFFFAISIGYHWLDAMVFLVGTVVAMVPEGLIVTVAASLALTAQKMAAKNCLIKNLDTIETLGCTSVICSDKTGTLTQNKIFVTNVCFENQIFPQDSLGSRSQSEPASWKELKHCISLCTNAEFKLDQAGNREDFGDPIDVALAQFLDLSRQQQVKLSNQFKRRAEIPFNNFDKFHLKVMEDSIKGGFSVFAKGAPETILKMCSTHLADGKETGFSGSARKKYEDLFRQLCHQGERVVALCDLRLPDEDFPLGFSFDCDDVNFPVDGFRFLGFVSMMNPPRPQVPEAVAICRSAGIKVIMITGDHPDTAKAIAKQVGIISTGKKTAEDLAEELKIPLDQVCRKNIDCIVFTGSELEEMSNDDIDELILSYNEIVFARMTPDHKLLVVESCQRLGGVVAVTGDGVNDCPAMSTAHVGIAMGLTGSTVSKKTADMILLDDNFATIVSAIEEGRLVFDNLKKSIAYTLSSNIPETAPFILFLVIGMPLALGTITIICIDLGTDIFPAIALAYESPELDLMKRLPRNPYTDKLVSSNLISVSCGQIGMIQASAGFYTYLVIMAEHGFLPWSLFNLRKTWDSISINDLQDSYGQEWTFKERKALQYTGQTGFFVAVVLVQWIDALVCKTRKLSVFSQGMRNHYLNAALVFETCLAAFLAYTPGMDSALQMYPLRWNWWLPAIPFALLIFAYDEFRKLSL